MYEDALERVLKYIEENPKEDDRSACCEAAWAMFGDDHPLADMVESESVMEHEWLYYVNVEGETICVVDGKAYLGDVDEIISNLNKEYAEKHDKVICIHCGYFNDKAEHPMECWSCEKHILDNEAIDEPQNMLEGFNEIEDGDYHMLLLQNELIPTHETKSRQTFLYVRLEYIQEHCSDFPYKYHISIITVNPSMAGKKGLAEMAKSFGMEVEDIPKDREIQAEMLIDYGTFATLWQASSNSRTKCFQMAKEEIPKINMMAGFYIDRPQNAIGTSGWDFMRGDILGGLKDK